MFYVYIYKKRKEKVIVAQLFGLKRKRNLTISINSEILGIIVYYWALGGGHNIRVGGG